MADQIHVNPAAIERLLAVASRFYASISDLIDEPNLRAERLTASLRDTQDSINFRIEHLRLSLEADDDSESASRSCIHDQLTAAHEKLSDVTANTRRLERSHADYRRFLRRCESLANQHASMARHYLLQVADDLRVYMDTRLDALPSDSYVNPIDFFGPSSAAPLATPHASLQPLSNYSDFPLPPGFSWLSVSRIEPTDNLSESRKVSFETIEHGFAILRRSILPTMKTFGSSVTIEWFQAQALAGGTTAEPSVDKVYEAFFGSDPIAIDRKAATPLHTIINGSHRIFVARRLGWPAVPVFFTDQKRG